MARPLRIEYPGAYYHIMNRGLSYREIFLDNKGREQYLDLVSDISSRGSVLGENSVEMSLWRSGLEGRGPVVFESCNVRLPTVGRWREAVPGVFESRCLGYQSPPSGG